MNENILADDYRRASFPCCGGSDESPPEHTQDCSMRAAPLCASCCGRGCVDCHRATNDALKGPIEKVIRHLGDVIPTDGAMLEEALNLNDVLSTRLRAAEAALAEERETVRRLEGELGQALAVAARRIGELEEAIADVADGFEQQGKFGLASQLRQFLPAATTPQADEPKPIATSPLPQVAQASAGPWSGNPEVCSSCHHSRTSHVEHSGPQGTCCECMCLNFTDWPDSPGDGEGGYDPLLEAERYAHFCGPDEPGSGEALRNALMSIIDAIRERTDAPSSVGLVTRAELVEALRNTETGIPQQVAFHALADELERGKGER